MPELADLKPWMYVGYRGFSKFVSSDDDFFFLRRFGTLHARVLLSMQDEIVDLEDQLQQIDNGLASPAGPDIHNGTFRYEPIDGRKQLLGDLRSKLKEYDDLVLLHSQLRAIPPVPRRNIQSVDNWLKHKKEPIQKEETAFLKFEDDLLPLVSKPKSLLRRLLELSQTFRLSKFWKTQPILPYSSIDIDATREVHYISDQRIDLFVTTVILSVGLAMLIGPLWILEFVTESKARLGIISLFITVFLALLSVTSTARPFECLAGAAAYSAVLMVFMQIGGGG